MPIGPNDAFQQQDEQRRLDETRLRDEERRERTRRFDDDEHDERERLDGDIDRDREGKAGRGSERGGGWRSLFGLRRAQTAAPHVEPAIEAGKPAKTPIAAPAVAPALIVTRGAGRGRAAVSVAAAVVLAGALVFTGWQRWHSHAAPGPQSLASAVAAPPLPAGPTPAATDTAVPEDSGTAIPVAEATLARDKAPAAALPAPDSPSGDPVNTATTEPPAAPVVAAAPANPAAAAFGEAPTQAAEQPNATPATATAAFPNDALKSDAEAAAPVVAAAAAPTAPDAAVPALVSVAQEAALQDATNQIAALNTRVEALQAQLLALQTAQQTAKAAPAETAPATAQPVRPRKPVRKATRAPAHEAPEPSAASTRAEPKLLAIDSWGGKPSVVVGIEQAGGSIDTRIRTLEPGDTLAGITLRSVDADAGQAVFDVGAGRAVTLNLEPR